MSSSKSGPKFPSLVERQYTHGKNVPQPPVVVLLRGQLLLAGVVKHEELLRQDLELRVTHGTELHLRRRAHLITACTRETNGTRHI